MYARQLTFPLPGNGPAVLTLAQPVPPETLQRLASSLAATFGSVQDAPADSDADAGQIEYASWLAQPGWLRH